MKADDWHSWNRVRTLANHSIGVALEFETVEKIVLERWAAEPIGLVIIPTTCFVTNKGGFPVLSKIHQEFLFKVFQVESI